MNIKTLFGIGMVAVLVNLLLYASVICGFIWLTVWALRACGVIS